MEGVLNYTSGGYSHSEHIINIGDIVRCLDTFQGVKITVCVCVCCVCVVCVYECMHAHARVYTVWCVTVCVWYGTVHKIDQTNLPRINNFLLSMQCSVTHGTHQWTITPINILLYKHSCLCSNYSTWTQYFIIFICVRSAVYILYDIMGNDIKILKKGFFGAIIRTETIDNNSIIRINTIFEVL